MIAFPWQKWKWIFFYWFFPHPACSQYQNPIKANLGHTQAFKIWTCLPQEWKWMDRMTTGNVDTNIKIIIKISTKSQSTDTNTRHMFSSWRELPLTKSPHVCHILWFCWMEQRRTVGDMDAEPNEVKWWHYAFLKWPLTHYARSPRIRRASWMSLGMMVTRLAWIAHRLVSSNRPTR